MSEINPKIVEEARKVIRQSEAGRKVLDGGEDTPPAKTPESGEAPKSKTRVALEDRSTSAVIVDLLAVTLAGLLALWLFSASTGDQRRAIQEYFSPDGPALQKIEPSGGSPQAWRGGGAVVLLPKAAAGAASSASSTAGTASESGSPTAISTSTSGTYGSATGSDALNFSRVQDALGSALGESAALRRLASHVQVVEVPEGLRIDLMNRSGLALFPRGSSRMHAHTRLLLIQVADAIGPLPNRMDLVAHLRPGSAGRRTEIANGRLTTDRAYASRRVLVEAGVKGQRFRRVAGAGGQMALPGAAAHSPEHERISILLYHRR